MQQHREELVQQAIGIGIYSEKRLVGGMCFGRFQGISGTEDMEW